MLGFIFAYPSFTISNFAKFFIFSAIAISIHLISQKVVAKKHGCTINLDLWKIQRFGFPTSMHFPRKLNLFFKKIIIHNLPVGLLLPLLVSLLSDGQIFFAVSFTTLITVHKGLRVGKKYRRLTDYESAKIIVFGPLANILLAALLALLNISMLNGLVFVNSMMAIFSMLPLPGLAGCSVFFGSRPLYIFSYAFILILALLLNFITSYAAILIALAAAVIAFISYMYFYDV